MLLCELFSIAIGYVRLTIALATRLCACSPHYLAVVKDPHLTARVAKWSAHGRIHSSYLDLNRVPTYFSKLRTRRQPSLPSHLFSPPRSALFLNTQYILARPLDLGGRSQTADERRSRTSWSICTRYGGILTVLRWSCELCWEEPRVAWAESFGLSSFTRVWLLYSGGWGAENGIWRLGKRCMWLFCDESSYVTCGY